MKTLVFRKKRPSSGGRLPLWGSANPGGYIAVLRSRFDDFVKSNSNKSVNKFSMQIVQSLPTSSRWVPNNSILAISYIVLCAFYTITICFNHAENMDGLQYAFAAEKASLTYIWDTRALLFEFINKLIYLTSDELGLATRSFLPIVGFTILISAASVLLMARLLIAGFGVSPVAGWAGAGMLALSYGFWRYTSAVEVYNGSVFLILIVANLLVHASKKPEPRWVYLLIAAVVSGIATLYYQPNAIFVFFAATVFLLRATNVKEWLLYGAVGSMVVIGGYIDAYIISGQKSPSVPAFLDFVMNRVDELPAANFDMKTIFKSLYFAIDSFCSINWVFSVEYLNRIMNELSPRTDHTSLRIAALAFKPIVYLSFATVAGLAVSLFVMLWKAIRSNYVQKIDSKLLFVASSIILYLPIVLMHGRHFELWIVLLPFFIMALSIFLFDNNVRSGHALLPVIFVVILGVHNFVSGVGPLQSAKNDYIRNSIRWVEESATGDDTVLIFRDRINHIKYRNYLLYYGGVNVLTVGPGAALFVPSSSYELRWQPFDQLVRKLGASNGRALVFGSFFKPDERMRNFAEGPALYKYYQSLAESFSRTARLLHADDAGKVYSIDMNNEMANQIAEISRKH